jgi:hypothetical protein
MTDQLLNGKPLDEAAYEELSKEYDAAMAWEAMCEVWTPENEARMRAIEAEIDQRSNLGKEDEE